MTTPVEKITPENYANSKSYGELLWLMNKIIIKENPSEFHDTLLEQMAKGDVSVENINSSKFYKKNMQNPSHILTSNPNTYLPFTEAAFKKVYGL
ncbi:MAG: hypothetical protein WC475_04135 [Candidatus Paceibacterota bacterium]